MSMIRKEFLEGIRTYRFMIIGIAFLFFALLNPVLNKMVLPGLLQSQFEGMSESQLSQMVVSTQLGSVRGYLSDTFEIVTLVLTLVLAGAVAGELKNKTLIFPHCSGKRMLPLVLSKLAVFGSAIMVAAVAAVVIDYYYAGFMFETDFPNIGRVVLAGAAQGLYFVFVYACVMMTGALFARPIVAGLVALVPAYGIRMLSPLLGIEAYTPSGLLTEGVMLSPGMGGRLIQPAIITVCIIAVLVLLVVIRLQSIEMTRRV